jgi:predicted transcriptional regulator
MTNRTMTVRLPEDEAAVLDKIAEVENVPVAAVVRDAISGLISQRAVDPAFQERLRASMERNQAILDRLAGT